MWIDIDRSISNLLFSSVFIERIELSSALFALAIYLLPSFLRSFLFLVHQLVYWSEERWNSSSLVSTRYSCWIREGLPPRCRLPSWTRKDEICSTFVSVSPPYLPSDHNLNVFSFVDKLRHNYIIPLSIYSALYKSSKGKELARQTFLQNRQIYHNIASKMIAKDLEVQ